MQIQLNELQTAALRMRMINSDSAKANAEAKELAVHAYLSAIMEGSDVPSNSPIASIDLVSARGTITVEIKDAETEGRTGPDSQLD